MSPRFLTTSFCRVLYCDYSIAPLFCFVNTFLKIFNYIFVLTIHLYCV
nr:MAG TPA: hypothetical protein [Caudoviricetes sp.]